MRLAIFGPDADTPKPKKPSDYDIYRDVAAQAIGVHGLYARAFATNSFKSWGKMLNSHILETLFRIGCHFLRQ